MSPPDASDYYKRWTAYGALQESVSVTSFRSVWALLSCQCCREPEVWLKDGQPLLPVPSRLADRIRWYDNVLLPVPLCACDEGESGNRLAQLQAHFVGHHQRIELVLLYLKPRLERIYAVLRSSDAEDQNNTITDEVADAVTRESKHVVSCWRVVGELIRGVAQNLDRMAYLDYVPRLAGVSGGNSPAMVPLTAKTAGLESLLRISDLSSDHQDLASAIRQRKPVGRVAEAFIDCLDALSRCWFEHVVTATTAIGITRGTKGTPNVTLVDRVLLRLHKSRLLAALGSLRSPITGIGIEMRQLYSYESYPLADNYLDLFVDCGPEFGTHSVGWQPKVYEAARKEFLKIRRGKRSAIWDHFYSETRPAFCRALLAVLGIVGHDGDCEDGPKIGVGLGSSVTEVLSRLVASVPHRDTLRILLAEDEFLTLQRCAAILAREGASVFRVTPENLQTCALNAFDSNQEGVKDHLSVIRGIIFVSLVNSCTQRVEAIEWVTLVPGDVIVVIDVTQAVANVPLAPTKLDELLTRPNIFVVGSLIKHGRCGEGVAFLACTRGPDSLIREPASGWTAYISGLAGNETADFESNRLFYDSGLEWDGGTPSWVEAAFVAVRVMDALPPVEIQHEYVKGIQAEFLKRVNHLLSDEQRGAVSDSNTLALPVSKKKTQALKFGLDYKSVSGTTYLRIGFGIQNLEYHLDALVDLLESTGALETGELNSQTSASDDS